MKIIMIKFWPHFVNITFKNVTLATGFFSRRDQYVFATLVTPG